MLLLGHILKIVWLLPILAKPGQVRTASHFLFLGGGVLNAEMWAMLPRRSGTDKVKLLLLLSPVSSVLGVFCSDSVPKRLLWTPGLPQKFSCVEQLSKSVPFGGTVVEN